MSKTLCLSRHDIEEAVKQYYKDYEPELFKRFNFDDFELYVDNARKGYLGVEFAVRERESDQAGPHSGLNNGSGKPSPNEFTR